jgi:protein gp37
MGDNTGIAWADSTCNAVTGCSSRGEECAHCYAKTMSLRLKGMGTRGYEDGFSVREHPDVLKKLSEWRRPRRVFMVSMGDLFHRGVSTAFIFETYRAMSEAKWHRYYVLTKREKRLKKFLISHEEFLFEDHIIHGVSVGTEKGLSRIPVLQSIPGIRKFVSFEPLIDIGRIVEFGSKYVPSLHGIEWIVIGGESGVGARPFNLDAAKSLVSYSVSNDIRVFMKQMGSHWAKVNESKTKKGTDMGEWPEWARIQRFPKGFWDPMD